MSWHTPIMIRVFSFLYEETLCFSISLSNGHTAKTQCTQQMPKACWTEYSLCAHGFWFCCTDAVQFIWIFWVKHYPIWSARISFSYSIVPFSKGPYFLENMYKIGKILIWLVGYFPDQKFYWGKGLLYEENRLFLGPCIDNLGSLVIIRGGGILYYTTGKFTQKPELHRRQSNSKRRIENFTILFLENNKKGI